MPCHSLDPMKMFADYLRGLNLNNPVVVSPDKGSRERTDAFARYLGDVEVVEFDKKRDTVTGAVQMVGNAAVAGREVIIADGHYCNWGDNGLLQLKSPGKMELLRIFAVATHPLLIGNGQYNIMNAGAEIIGSDCVESRCLPKSRW